MALSVAIELELLKLESEGIQLQNITLKFKMKKMMYSQTCWHNHLYKMTTLQDDQCWACPSQFSYNCYCVRQPVSFFVPKIKKNLSKTTTVKLILQRNGKQQIKKMSLLLYLLLLHLLICYLIMKDLLNACHNWTFTFNTGQGSEFPK